jgi:N-acetylmuramoyl-L-alanine amidase CwlA
LKTQLYKDIINKMFEISKHEITFDDVLKRKDNWFQQYTMTADQQSEWIEWSENYLRKKTNMSKYAINITMQWLILDVSLLVVD